MGLPSMQAANLVLVLVVLIPLTVWVSVVHQSVVLSVMIVWRTPPSPAAVSPAVTGGAVGVQTPGQASTLLAKLIRRVWSVSMAARSVVGWSTLRYPCSVRTVPG